MKQINFYVDLCRINSIFSLATLVNIDISVGNIFARSKYICLCEVAEIEDDTNDDDWLNPQNVVGKTTVILIDAYIEFMDLLQKIVKNPKFLYTSPDLLFSTIELAKTIYVTNDFIDGKIVLLLEGILSTVKDTDMRIELSSIIKDLEFERQKIQNRDVELFIGSFFGELPDA